METRVSERRWAMSSTWNKLVNLVIRPPRAQYDPNEHLPGPRFVMAGVTHIRRDIDLAGADGLTLGAVTTSPM